MATDIEDNKIEVGKETLKSLDTTRKWAMFLAIIGFISLGLVALMGILAGTFLSAFNTRNSSHPVPEVVIFLLLLIMGALYFFPLHFLFRFSKHTAKAVATKDKLELHKALLNLKAYFVFIGVLIIVILAIYIFALIMSGASISFLKGL